MSKDRKKIVFVAHKKTSQPQVVRFNTKDGMVSFTAKKKVERPELVVFETNPKKKK
jgi:hypothetical protein